MHEKNHWFAVFVFVVVAVGGIAFFAFQGIQQAKEADKEKERHLVMQRMSAAINYGKQGLFNQSQDVLKELVREYPQVKEIWLNLAITQIAMGELDEAEKSLKEALKLKKDFWDATAELASIEAERKNFDKAIEILGSIPPGKGSVASRLMYNPTFRNLSDDPRIQALKKKHFPVDSSIRVEGDRRRHPDNIVFQ